MKIKKDVVIDRLRQGRCPYCGSDDTWDGNMTSDPLEARQKMGCYQCEMVWSEVYEFKAVQLINLEDNPTIPFEAL